MTIVVLEELEVIDAFPKYRGVETVVRLVRADGKVFIDVRDRIEVDGQVTWGRGYLLPAELGSEVGKALQKAGERE